MHQICYVFYWSIKKLSKLAQKADCFGSVWEFFVYALLHPISYTPRFCQMKDLIEICICGKLNQYSISGCEVKNFLKAFCVDSVSMKWPLWGVLGPYSPKYCSVLLIFWPEVIFQSKKHSVWKILQNFKFWLKWNAPKIYSFGPFWGPSYHRKTKNIA